MSRPYHYFLTIFCPDADLSAYEDPVLPCNRDWCSCVFNMPHFFHFLPLPQGHKSLRPTSPPAFPAPKNVGCGWACTCKLAFKILLAISISTSSKSPANNLRPSFLYSTNGSLPPYARSFTE